MTEPARIGQLLVDPDPLLNLAKSEFMQLSQHNIVSQIRGSGNYFIVNPLSGQADILEPEIGRALLKGEVRDTEAFAAKGYVVDPAEEQLTFKRRYLESLDRRENDEIQVFFVPWYACNFNCSYCYQSSYQPSQAPLSSAVIDAFFENIQHQFAGRRYYVTLFGGEPLLAGGQARSLIEYFLKTASDRNISVAIVTNGYTLSEYVPLLAQSSIREVQVTLDGTREIHDGRRPLKAGGAGTFDRIVQGIDDALEAGLKINFRVVVDKENIDSLPALARVANEKGWTSNGLFKPQLGRNYELHHCAAQPEKLFSRIALYEKIYALTKEHPEILEFHNPAYSVSRFLFENGELPEPLFDACPGCKTEWALDYTGGIYSCTATVGKADERLGTFYPEVTLDAERVETWRRRDVTTIDKCGCCPVRLACGGGCGAVAKNQNGSVNTPDCRPVKQLLELGIAQYFPEEVSNG
jgi:uncharacterized protein